MAQSHRTLLTLLRFTARWIGIRAWWIRDRRVWLGGIRLGGVWLGGVWLRRIRLRGPWRVGSKGVRPKGVGRRRQLWLKPRINQLFLQGFWQLLPYVRLEKVATIVDGHFACRAQQPATPCG